MSPSRSPRAEHPGAAAGAPSKEVAALRRAALLLHGVRPEDREWLLEQLPPPARDQLRPLIEELRDLGIPAERTILQEIVAHEPEPARVGEAPRPPVATRGLPDEAELQRADPRLLAELLRGEPAPLLARLIGAMGGTWGEALLHQLTQAERRAVLQASRELGEVGPALREHLLAAVARRVRSHVDPRPAAGLGPRWLGRFRVKVGSP